MIRHGAEQYAGDLECVFYGYYLDRAILKIAEAAYCLIPSLGVMLVLTVRPEIKFITLFQMWDNGQCKHHFFMFLVRISRGPASVAVLAEI